MTRRGLLRAWPLVLASAAAAAAVAAAVQEKTGPIAPCDRSASAACPQEVAADEANLLQVRDRVGITDLTIAAPSRQGSRQEKMSAHAADDPMPADWPTATDTGANANFDVQVQLWDTGTSTWYPPDGTYTSIYQYAWEEQYKAQNGVDVHDWNGYAYTETHQFVYTGVDSLTCCPIKVYVQPNWWDTNRYSDVRYFKISFLGYPGSEYFTTTLTQHVDDMWPVDNGDDSKGIEIDLGQITQAWNPGENWGSYESNPIHISIVPLDENQHFIGQTGVAVFLSYTPYRAGEKGDWCSDPSRPQDEICCYLVGDPANGNTLGMDWNPRTYTEQQYSNNPDACFGDGGMNQVYQTSDGVWESTLNNLIKNNPDVPIRIVIDAQTTVNFPISNLWRSGSSEDFGFDVGYGRSRIEVAGFGRINGYEIQAAYGSGTKGMSEEEYTLRASLLWITGNGAPESGTGWREARWGEPFQWANGRDDLHNEGDSGDILQYGVSVWGVQVGYGPPISDAPVSLGDFRGKRPGGDDDTFGAAVLVLDTKFVSFSTRSDGIAMRDPASYGKGLFIHGSDDILKTTTGIDHVYWGAFAVMFYAGFGEYGSLSCPCCFGPTGGFQPVEANFCNHVRVQDVIVPVLFAPWPENDGYKAEGLIATKWGVKEYGKIPGYGKIEPGTEIFVDDIHYFRWLIVENGWNRIDIAWVNIMMNSNERDAANMGATYDLSDDAFGFDEMTSEVYITQSYENQGWFKWNWGTGESSAQIVGGGAINAYGIKARMASWSPCASGDSGDYWWTPCPTAGDVPDSSWLYDSTGMQQCSGEWKDGTAQPFKDLCADGNVVPDHPTASLWGSDTCQGNQWCGLRFPYFTGTGTRRRRGDPSPSPAPSPPWWTCRRRRRTHKPHGPWWACRRRGLLGSMRAASDEAKDIQ